MKAKLIIIFSLLIFLVGGLVVYQNRERYYLTVLTYHHVQEAGSFDPETQGGLIITPQRLQEQLEAFQVAGYQTISLSELRAYQAGQASLPEQPLLLTFDDGYESNYLLAYPILQKLQMKATIFVIGANLRNEEDPNQGLAAFMTWQEAKEMYESGLVDIQSHTYDLHFIVPNKDEGQPKTTKLWTDDYKESDSEYKQRIQEDLTLSRDIIQKQVGNEVLAISFPYGAYNKNLVKISSELGMDYQFSIKRGLNSLKSPPKVYDRITMNQNYSGSQALEYIQQSE